ncbi:MAG: Hsp20/alpha crystallin family protein [Chloroflexi bacterium]|nr:Hsp20/alpha crystallin family protein [Chloroflexota bacterium]
MTNGIAERSLAERRLRDMEEVFDHLFDGLMADFAFAPRRFFLRPRRRTDYLERWLPEMDVVQEEGKLVARMDLPGVERKDIDVRVEGDLLIVQGHREQAKEVQREDYYRAERVAGEFSRCVELPDGADTGNIQATYKDGVLEVVVPTPKAALVKKVTIPVK